MTSSKQNVRMNSITLKINIFEAIFPQLGLLMWQLPLNIMSRFSRIFEKIFDASRGLKILENWLIPVTSDTPIYLVHTGNK